MFVVDCDASNHTIAAELSQVQNDKEETTAYASNVLLPVQRKYCTTRKELLFRIPDSIPLCHQYKPGVEVAKLPCGGCAYCTRTHTQWEDLMKM